jgi:hypothetical protein
MTQPARANQAKKIGEFGSPNVKVPELYDIERGNDSIPDALLEYLLFEQIGGQELLLLSRTDTLNGTNPSYSIISNLVDLRFQYAPSNIISLPNSLPDIFKRYSIVLDRYVPELDNANNDCPNGYVELETTSSTFNSLILEFKNIQPNQQVEVQIMSDGEFSLTSFDS